MCLTRYSWGLNAAGQCGTGNIRNVREPTAIAKLMPQVVGEGITHLRAGTCIDSATQWLAWFRLLTPSGPPPCNRLHSLAGNHCYRPPVHLGLMAGWAGPRTHHPQARPRERATAQASRAGHLPSRRHCHGAGAGTTSRVHVGGGRQGIASHRVVRPCPCCRFVLQGSQRTALWRLPLGASTR